MEAMIGRGRPARLAFPLAFLALALSGCAPVGTSIRRIDAAVRETKRKQDVMLARSAPLGESYPYPQGTEIMSRSDSGGVRKIELTAFGDMGKTREDYFFRNGEFIYCERSVWRYDKPGGEEVTRESRGYYFKDDRAIGSIDVLSGKRRRASVQLSAEALPFVEKAYSFLRLAGEAGGP